MITIPKRNRLIDAIDLGKQFTEQKSSLKHGEWLPWLKNYILGTDMSQGTVNNYMQLYKNRKLLIELSITTIQEAYDYREFFSYKYS